MAIQLNMVKKFRDDIPKFMSKGKITREDLASYIKSFMHLNFSDQSVWFIFSYLNIRYQHI